LSHNALVYIAFLMVGAVWFFLERTRPGLRLRAVGENPAMVEAAGMSVQRLRYQALLMNGVLCGLAGAYLTLAQNASFSPNMTAGCVRGRTRPRRPSGRRCRPARCGSAGHGRRRT
ncbi:MAG: hypothetical protein EOP35_15660, partial [Rubrivivax sp.]